jgi:hypothetical protein
MISPCHRCAIYCPWGFRGLAFLRYRWDIELTPRVPAGKAVVKDGVRRIEVKDSLEAALNMTTLIVRAVFAAALALATTSVTAQESSNLVATKTDWSVFTEGSPKECWGVSSPRETVNTKGGQPAQVRRGDILLFVTFRPGSGAMGEVSFTGGYPFAPGSTVRMDIDGTTYDLFSDGEWAWPGSAEADATLLNAMKRGTTATLSAASARGTETKDTFSLRGFTAAMEEAEKRCK